MNKLIVLLTLFCSSAYSQTSIDYEKISKACELWGYIKYFHPSRPGAEFDSSFAAHVPKMLEAKNDNDWEKLISDWLTILDDPATKVVVNMKQHEGTFSSEFQADSILYVKISGTDLSDNFRAQLNFFSKVLEDCKKSKGIIFDIRQVQEIPQRNLSLSLGLSYYFDAAGLNDFLATAVVPQFKSIHHSQLTVTHERLTDATTFGNFESSGKRVVWIVNKFSELPVVSLTHHLTGAGVILSETADVMHLLSVTKTFIFSDNLNVRFRIAEGVIPGQRPVQAKTYKASEDPATIAQKIMREGWTKLSNNPINDIPLAGSHRLKTSQKLYADSKYPSVGYRILAASKIFNVIELFFPYYELMDKDWKVVLQESLPEFVEAKTDVEYGLAVAKMFANINDSHGFVSGNNGLKKLIEGVAPPVMLEWIEQKVVITHFRNDSICKANNISIGDVVVKVDGLPIEKKIEKLEMYFPHSTKPRMRQLAARYSVRGQEGQEGVFTILDQRGKTREVKLKWLNSYNNARKYKLDTIQFINTDIGYVDLDRMVLKQVDGMFEKFKNTKAIIFDMRGYPRGTTLELTQRLLEKSGVPLALYRNNEVSVPNIRESQFLTRKSYSEFIQTFEPSEKWKYKGKTVMLINQEAASASETTGLCFKAAHHTTFIGSHTDGTDGNPIDFSIPGGMTLYFSGFSVSHPDGRQLQRIGLIPDVEVTPTIKGIRAGKDEVLEKAVSWIKETVK